MASPLGFPPYSQQSSSGDRYSFDDLPPELALEHQALNRKQQIANMLIQQGLQPAQGQMVGGWYVPASPLQGAAGLAQILAGKYATSRNDEARRGLVGKNNDMLAQAMKGYKDAIADKTSTVTPETYGPGAPVPTGVKPGDGFSPQELAQPTALHSTTQEALGAVANNNAPFFKEGPRPTSDPSTAVTTVTPRTSEERRQAIIDYFAMSQIPQAQRMGQFMLGEMDRKEARGDQLAQRQSEMDQKKMEFGMIPAAKQADLDQRKAEFEGVSGSKKAELGQRATEFAGVPGSKQAEIAAALQRHATPSGTAVMEDKTKRELYPVASGNALASVDVQGQIALQAHQDRATQFEQNKRQDQAMLDVKKGQGLSDEAYRRDKLAMDAKHQQQQLALEAERNKISSMFHEAQAKKQGSDGPKLSVGEAAIDKDFAKDYVEFTTGGYADVQKGLGQLRDAVGDLKKGGVTGPLTGNTPDVIRGFTNPKSIAVRDSVQEIVQRNLRLILGAQFTEKEGNRLIERAYNEKQGEPENIKRVNRLIDQIGEAAKAKADAAEYFQKNGTLKGWNGRLYRMSDFDSGDSTSPSQPSSSSSGGVAPFNDAEKERRYQEFKKNHK